jgi:hypothetical protein
VLWRHDWLVQVPLARRGLLLVLALPFWELLAQERLRAAGPVQS